IGSRFRTLRETARPDWVPGNEEMLHRGIAVREQRSHQPNQETSAADNRKNKVRVHVHPLSRSSARRGRRSVERRPCAGAVRAAAGTVMRVREEAELEVTRYLSTQSLG